MAWSILSFLYTFLILFISVYSAPHPISNFRIGLISDLDMYSKDPTGSGYWLSYLKEGDLYLKRDKLDPSKINISIEWDESATHVIKSGLSNFGRGMELSTLNLFNGRLLSCDDRTGIIYELVRNGKEINPVSWAILADGNYSGPSFKCEWATVKDGDLIVGGNGRTLINPDGGGKLIKTQKFIKRITPRGEVSHWNWEENYDKMAKALGVQFPGFVVHEAAGWSELLKNWMFMPRYVSNEGYDLVKHQFAGSNLVIMASENFDDLLVKQAGNILTTHGFSSFKWIPNTDDQLVLAIKTLEVGERLQSFIMAFDMEGKILLPETKIDDKKYEGIEFI